MDILALNDRSPSLKFQVIAPEKGGHGPQACLLAEKNKSEGGQGSQIY